MTTKPITKRLADAEQFIEQQPHELREALLYALGVANITILTDEAEYIVTNDSEFDALLYVKLVLALFWEEQSNCRRSCQEKRRGLVTSGC